MKARRQRTAPWTVSAARSGALLVALCTLDCAVPPEQDCTAKATCTALSIDDAAARDATVSDSATDHDADASPYVVPACGNQYVCIPPVPDGWLGPVAEWQGSTGAAPDCPPGYDGGSYTDTYGALGAPDASCVCSCVATGQECTASVTIFTDLTCSNPCASSLPAGACAAVTGCPGEQGTLRAETPAPRGGTCVPSVAMSVAPAAWMNPSRICPAPAATIGDAGYACPTAGNLCARTPALPFGTRPCIAEIVPDGQIPPATCPVDYPNGPYLSYSSMSDDRACASCACGKDPDGGTCTGTIALTGTGDDCTPDAGATYAIGSGCGRFSLADPVANITGSYVVVGAQCAITTDTHAVGSAAPTNPVQVVCCLPL